MRKDEMNNSTKKTIRKIDIDEIPFEDEIPMMDDFEFQPDYDSIGYFMDDMIEESKEHDSIKKNKIRSVNIDDGDLKFQRFEKSDSPLSGKQRIKKIELTPEDLEERKEVRKKHRSQNPEILVVTYFFSALFIFLIGYFVYFNAFVSENVINSAYNVRINALAETMIRGDIVSNDGTILAETVVNENGDEQRYYPYGRIFSHVIGTSEINQSGIELSHNFYLLQSNGNPMLNAIKDIRGEKKQGDRIVTTLDAELQEVTYNALGNNDGAVVAIEPSTGKILAMVSKPDYNPNTLVSDYEFIVSQEGNQSLLNKSTFGLFIPGSIFKSFTALSYVRSGGDAQDYSYACEGRIYLNDFEYITCYNHTVHGYLDFWGSYAYSCNASFGHIGLEVSSDQLTQTCESLFFNTTLPTDIPHKNSQFELKPDASDWEVAATAIGQGKTQVSPLHMTMFVSAVANGGNLMEPYLVDSVVTAESGRRVKKFLPESFGQILTTSEASLLGSMMEDVGSYGTAQSLSGYGYTVAGKTGTAEVNGKGDNSWFIGYAPAEQPQIAICVLVENDAGYYASALPVANAVLENYLNQ